MLDFTRSVCFSLLFLTLACTNVFADWPDGDANRSADDLALVRRAKDTLLGNVVTADAWKPYRGIEPSPTKYKGIWNWDAAFHAMAVSHWDAQLARDQVRILFDHQLENGALPDLIYQSGKLQTASTKPPVMAWAVAIVDHRVPDDAFVNEIYPKLLKMTDFFMSERGGKRDGLFYYAGSDVGWDSGWDTSIRWDNGYRKPKDPDHRLWAIDLNCYMVMHYRALAYLAGRSNRADEQKHWSEEADALAKRINENLWDEQLGYFVDRDRQTKVAGTALTPAAFMPLFIHIADDARTERMAKLAADPKKFYPGMPTAAYDSAGFKAKDYWRGPAWLNTTYFAAKGLRDYGQTKLAEDLRSTLLGWVRKDPSTIWEYYDSTDGAGGGAKTFGWSAAFAIAFVEDWDNDNLTWLFPKIAEKTDAAK